jgi:hypothetical protein
LNYGVVDRSGYRLCTDWHIRSKRLEELIHIRFIVGTIGFEETERINGTAFVG